MVAHFGRYGRVDPNNPEAAGVCDRGGEIRKLRDLMPEMHWSGGRLVPNGFLCCRFHIDQPNPQIGGQRPLRADPVPVRNPRPLHDVLPPDDPFRDPQGRPLTDPQGNPLLEPDS